MQIREAMSTIQSPIKVKSLCILPFREKQFGSWATASESEDCHGETENPAFPFHPLLQLP
jgi:hypothetical protein